MPSPPLDSKHGRATSGVKFHHRFWTSHSVKQRRAWHAIISLRQHKRSNDVGRGMTSPPLDCTHGRTTSGVALRHRPATAHTVGNVGRGMTSPPLGITHGQTSSGMTYHHRPWTGNMVERCRAWHAITALGQHTRSDDVGCGMLSSPLGSTNSRTTSGVACHHRPWIAHKVG